MKINHSRAKIKPKININGLRLKQMNKLFIIYKIKKNHRRNRKHSEYISYMTGAAEMSVCPSGATRVPGMISPTAISTPPATIDVPAIDLHGKMLQRRVPYEYPIHAPPEK